MLRIALFLCHFSLVAGNGVDLYTFGAVAPFKQDTQPDGSSIGGKRVVRTWGERVDFASRLLLTGGWWNPNMRHMSGHPVEEVRGKNGKQRIKTDRQPLSSAKFCHDCDSNTGIHSDYRTTRAQHYDSATATHQCIAFASNRNAVKKCSGVKSNRVQQTCTGQCSKAYNSIYAVQYDDNTCGLTFPESDIAEGWDFIQNLSRDTVSWCGMTVQKKFKENLIEFLRTFQSNGKKGQNARKNIPNWGCDMKKFTFNGWSRGGSTAALAAACYKGLGGGSDATLDFVMSLFSGRRSRALLSGSQDEDPQAPDSDDADSDDADKQNAEGADEEDEKPDEM